MTGKYIKNGIDIFTVENDQLKVSIVPAMGGRILAIYNKHLHKEFLWLNAGLPFSTSPPGSEYDPNFLGGVDELIPNDIPETIDSIDYPDHGELWTTALKCIVTEEKITVHGKLPLCGLYYSKTLSLEKDSASMLLEYALKNESGQPRHFMWKLHAALAIAEGDKLNTSAIYSKVVDPAYSRFKNELTEFNWPTIENTDASAIPAKNGSMDFLYLYNTPSGEMQLEHKNGDHLFSYSYDKKTFPYQWWFASYGGFLDHYVAILEPCTNMPLSVNEAIEKKQSAYLDPGASISTTVRIYAGEKKNYLSL